MAQGKADQTDTPTGDDAPLDVDVSLSRGAGDAQAFDPEAFRRDYAAVAAASKREHRARLDKEAKALQKLADKHRGKLESAARQAGVDFDQLEIELKQLAQAADATDMEQRIQQLQARYMPLVNQALKRSGIDRGSARRELTAAVEVPPYAHLGDGHQLDERPGTRRLDPDADLADGFLGGSWSTEPQYTPPPPPPPPQYSQVSLRPPYTYSATSGRASAVATTGRMSSYISTWVGSTQTLASVGSPFFADANTRRIRAEVTIDANAYTSVGATWGYASAEVILNLRVLDGSRIAGSDRRSLCRAWGVVLWVSSSSAAGQYTLACEFAHSYGIPRNYAVIAELECWAGGGGALVISPASASGGATALSFNITLTR